MDETKRIMAIQRTFFSADKMNAYENIENNEASVARTKVIRTFTSKARHHDHCTKTYSAAAFLEMSTSRIIKTLAPPLHVCNGIVNEALGQTLGSTS